MENSVDLETIGVNAKFGVDVVYEGYEAGNSDINTEQEVEASVVDVESGKLVSASTDIAATLSETESAISAESLEGRTIRSRNKVVVLDPGHGGSDGGAAANGLVEKNLTLKIAQYCKEELEKYSGVTVYMTRSTDVAVGLEERVQMAKNWGADVFVSIHMNSASPAATGAEVWYPNSSYNSEIHNNGQKLASDIENELVSLGLANRGVKIRNSESGSKYSDGSIADYYSVIRNSKLAGFPGIIVEHAFLTNSADAEKLKQESFIKKVGIADATGIAKYFNLSKEEDSGKFTASVIKKNDFARTFTVKINGKLSDGESYRVAVWSNKNGQDPNNLWTIVNKQSGNDVEINYNTTNYKNADGIYNIHIYKCDKNEKVTCVQTMTCNMYNSSANCKVQDTTGEEKNFKASAKITNVPDTLNRIQFAVWSDQNGQDDLNWYTGTKSGNVWSTNIAVKNYKRYGKYNVHAYAVLNDGTSVFLKAMSFNVTKPTAKLTVEKQNGSNGTAEVTISNIQSKSGINSVLVPVWSRGNQSDLVWYQATKINSTTYKATVNIANHKKHAGTYKINVYLETGNGMQVGIGGCTQEIKNTGLYTIMGHSDVTIAQMVTYYKKNNLTYDQYSGRLSQYNGVLAKGGAANIETYCTIFKQEAEAEGVRVEVAFAQAMLETGFLKFGGDVKPNQYNFAGIGATGGVPGNEFSDVREGIRAQIQHLKCYASDVALNNPCVDPRWGSWLRNKAPYVQWLSKANNPYGIGWATDAGYAEKLLNMIKNLKTC